VVCVTVPQQEGRLSSKATTQRSPPRLRQRGPGRHQPPRWPPLIGHQWWHHWHSSRTNTMNTRDAGTRHVTERSTMPRYYGTQEKPDLLHNTAQFAVRKAARQFTGNTFCCTQEQRKVQERRAQSSVRPKAPFFTAGATCTGRMHRDSATSATSTERTVMAL
jgi:hypothetical protein